jgi:uncharacterized protein
MDRLMPIAISLASLALIATGCGTSAQPKYYSLASTAASDGAPPTIVTVMVGPVSIPASVDRPQFVLQSAPNKVDVEEFNRWSAPLGDSIARVVAGDLSAQLGTPDVATAPLANFVYAYRVTIDVQRFESVPGQSALLEAVWTVRKSANGDVRSGRTVAHEPVQGTGFDTLAAAHSRALTRMSSDIAAAIREEASQKSADVNFGPIPLPLRSRS